MAGKMKTLEKLRAEVARLEAVDVNDFDSADPAEAEAATQAHYCDLANARLALAKGELEELREYVQSIKAIIARVWLGGGGR